MDHISHSEKGIKKIHVLKKKKRQYTVQENKASQPALQPFN